MPVIKSKVTKEFTILKNNLLNDEKLSFKARGLLSFMLSLPDDWQFYSTEIVKHSDKDGQRSINSAIRELKENGYLEIKQTFNDKGKFNGNEWLVYDYPKLKTTHVRNAHAQNENAQNAHAQNDVLQRTNNTNTNNTNGGGEESENSLQTVINNFQQNIGVLNGKNINDLQVWTKDLPVDVINYAVDIAADNNAQTYSYVNSILKRWFQQNIKTLDQAKANSVKNKRQISNKSNNKRGVESEEYGW